jgi:hypothetical protein
MLARIRRRWASATVGPPTPRAPRSRRLTVAAGRRLFVPDLNEAHAILAGAREGGYEMNNSPDWLAIPPRGRSARPTRARALTAWRRYKRTTDELRGPYLNRVTGIDE